MVALEVIKEHKCNYVADTRNGFEDNPEDTKWVAELIKKRNELRKEELMNAVLNSDKSYEEILAFVQGKDVE